MGNQSRKRIVCGMICICALAGCGAKKQADEVRTFSRDTYTKVEYQYMEVVREDLESSINLSLECDNFQIKKYNPPYEEMEIDSFYVGEGDIIKKGQLLAGYRATECDKQLAAYEEEHGKLLLMKEHYEKLYDIDPSDQYHAMLENINSGLTVNGLYLSELRAKKDTYSIYAEEDGMVTGVADDLMNTVISKKAEVINLIYSDQIYSGTSDVCLELTEGEVFDASSAGIAYEVEFLSRETLENQTYQYFFRVVNAEQNFCKRNYLELNVERPIQKNVIWLPTNCVKNNGQTDYVYVLDENGYCEIREIVIDNVVDGKVVVSSGIEEGDRVVIR